MIRSMLVIGAGLIMLCGLVIALWNPAMLIFHHSILLFCFTCQLALIHSLLLKHKSIHAGQSRPVK